MAFGHGVPLEGKSLRPNGIPFDRVTSFDLNEPGSAQNHRCSAVKVEEDSAATER